MRKLSPLLLTLLLPPLLFGKISQDEGVRRVRAHLLIEDAPSALEEAKKLVLQFPKSLEAKESLVEALAANGFEREALEAWNRLSLEHPNLIGNRHLLEELSWGVIKNGLNSTQYGVRLASLIGSFLTQDIRAIPILKRMMRDSNAVVRSVAVQMSRNYRDAPLKEEIARLMQEEKVWIVRLEVIRAIGALKMKEMTPQLHALIQSDKATYEERQFAVEALLGIYEEISLAEWDLLAESNRAGMRYLACSIAEHFRMEEAKEGIFRLMQDSHPGVKVAAINAFGLYYFEKVEKERAKKLLEPALKDPNATVAITAAWAALLIDPSYGQSYMSAWLKSDLAENRRLAAAALSATGERGLALSVQTLRESQDPYVQANVALGLLGQRKEVALCCDVIDAFLQNEKRLWMWDTYQNPLFQVLSPSRVRYVDHIPNYPEAIDQMTRLNLVSLLAIVEDPRALTSLKTFLQKRSWGITGVAAATLLQEGDDTSLEVVRQLLTDSDPNVRLQACLVLAMFGRDETVLRELQNAYVEADHEKKLHILEAMGRVGNVETFTFLISVFQEPFPILRVAAAAAMIQSLNR